MQYFFSLLTKLSVVFIIIRLSDDQRRFTTGGLICSHKLRHTTNRVRNNKDIAQAFIFIEMCSLKIENVQKCNVEIFGNVYHDVHLKILGEESFIIRLPN